MKNNNKIDNINNNIYNSYFPIQFFIFDNLKNIYIHCNNENLKTDHLLNNDNCYPKIIYIQDSKQNLWMENCIKLECYGFKDKSYNLNNLLIKYKNNMLNNKLETYMNLFNIDNYTSFQYKTYIYIELTKSLHVLIQWLEFWNIVKEFNNEFVSINLNNNNYLQIYMTEFAIPSLICNKYTIKNRTGYDPLSINQLEDVNNFNMLNINVNQILNMDDESQTILFNENEDDSYKYPESLYSNDDSDKYSDEMSLDDINIQTINNDEEEEEENENDEEQKKYNYYNIDENEFENIQFFINDYVTDVNDKKKICNQQEDNTTKEIFDTCCSICMKESDEVYIVKLGEILNKETFFQYYYKKKENCLIECPCQNKKHFICLYCLYQCYLSELNVMVELGYDNYNYNNEGNDKIKNVSKYRYCFEPSTKIVAGYTQKITGQHLNVIMNWIGKNEQVNKLLDISKLQIADLLTSCKNILWYFYEENEKSSICKKLTFEHFLNIPTTTTTILNKQFIDKIWYQIKKILKNKKVTVTCPECKQEIEKISDCNAIRHCNIDICYFCGMFSRKYDYLPSKHWDENGLIGCPRYYEDNFCTNNINYKCNPNECYNQDYTDCNNFTHLKGKYYLDLTRQYNMLYHKLYSLPDLIKNEIINLLKLKLSKQKSKKLYRYKTIENDEKINFRKIILIEWLINNNY